MSYDIPTLGFVISLISVLLVIILLSQFLSDKSAPGVGWWVLGVIAIATGMVLLLLRMIIDNRLITIVLANFLYISGMAFFYHGFRLYFGIKKQNWTIPLILTAFLIPFVVFTYLDNSFIIRTALVGVAVAAFSLLAAYVLFYHRPAPLRRSANFCGTVMAAFGVVYLIRALDALLVTEVKSLFDNNWFQLYGFLAILITLVFLTYGIVFMLNQQLAAGLAEAQKDLAASQAQYSVFMDFTPDIVYLKDDQLRYRMVNKAQADFFGKTGEEMTGLSDADLMPPEMAANCHRSDQEVIQSGDTRINLELVGDKIYETRKFPVPLTHGGVGVGAFIRDITESRRASEELLKEQSLLKAIMDYLPYHVFFKDRKSRFIRINQAQAKRLGLNSPEEAVGKSDFDFFSEAHAHEAFEDEQTILRTGQPLVKEEIEQWPDRPDAWVSTVKMPLYDRSGVLIGTFGISMDIDERKRHEEEIALKNQQLEELVAEKDRLFSIIAHDLRSPFNAILGLTELMADEQEGFSPAQMRKSAKIVWNSAQALNNQLGNLLEWSRIQMNAIHVDPVTLNLHQEIETELPLFAEMANSKQIRMINRVSSQVTVIADRQMLYSVLRNLITNALKFTNAGGVVELSAEAESEGVVQVSIRDSGIGMGPELLSRLFELNGQAYRRGTSGEPSSGLGLVICRQLVEKLQGRIWAESQEGQGTTFHFTLPCPGS